MSFIPFLLSQRKEPVVTGKVGAQIGLGTELIYDHPTTCPRSLIRNAMASVPVPRVPRSCITPLLPVSCP